MAGHVIKIFYPRETTDGLAICELMNWSGYVFKFKRAVLSEFISRKESTKSGVYILMGSDPADIKQTIYVGESDNVGDRLRQHNKNPDKDFWSDTFVVCSKDDNLTKAHILFLESLIYNKISMSRRYDIHNTKLSIYDKLPESDAAYLQNFNSKLVVLLAAIGFDVFVPAREGASAQAEGGQALAHSTQKQKLVTDPIVPPDQSLEIMLTDRKTGLIARALESQGKVLVLKGSHANPEVGSLTPRLVELRNQLKDQGILIPAASGDRLEFTADYSFDGPSPSAALIAGRSVRAFDEWRDANSGQTLREVYAARADSQSPGSSDIS